MSDKPPNFPKNIKLHSRDYMNWSQTIKVSGLWTCEPANADEVVQICNWAKDSGWQIRPRGIRHGWSPLTVVEGTSSQAKIIIADTTANLTAMSFIAATGTAPPQVKVGVGATLEQLLAFLQQQTGGKGSAPGYSFPQTPAPGNLTVGGMLAINAHGTGVPSPADDFALPYGSLSNLILAFTAVVTDPTNPKLYQVRSFQRGEGDADVFLAHVGRAFLIDATLQVIDNYNMRCQSIMSITADTLFAAPTTTDPAPANSLMSFLKQSGRVEAIWYPFTTEPWFKVWTVAAQQPAGSKLVTAPYNYPFSDNLPTLVTTLLKLVTSVAPGLTPELEAAFADFTQSSLAKDGLSDLWGASMNTLLYIKDTTLRVTANGYAVQMRQSDVQQAVHDFTTQFTTMLTQYQANNSFPINSPLEIRVTALDDPSKIITPTGATPRSPLISALSYDEVAQQNGWDVALWLDVLSLPGTAGLDDFYTELETWFLQRFTGTNGRVMPEWSKGWAYTVKNGAWSNAAFLSHIRQSFTTGRTDSENWNHEVVTLKGYDNFAVFTNSFLDQLFVLN